MARVVSCVILSTLLAGCGSVLPVNTPATRLSAVINTQEQAQSAYAANDLPRATTLYLQLTKMVPREADYWYMLGNVYVRAQDPDRAVLAYQQAIARDASHTRAWHNLGIVRMRQATAAFEASASTAKPTDPLHDVSARLADALSHVGLGTVAKSQATAVNSMPVSVTRTAAARRKPGTSP